MEQFEKLVAEGNSLTKIRSRIVHLQPPCIPHLDPYIAEMQRFQDKCKVHT
jgi:hypothetical protein